MLYAVAGATAFRKAALASLTPAHFTLDALEQALITPGAPPPNGVSWKEHPGHAIAEFVPRLDEGVRVIAGHNPETARIGRAHQRRTMAV